MADQLVHDVVVAHKRSDVDRSQTGLEHQDREEDNQTLEKATMAPPSCLSENPRPKKQVEWAPRHKAWIQPRFFRQCANQRLVGQLLFSFITDVTVKLLGLSLEVSLVSNQKTGQSWRKEPPLYLQDASEAQHNKFSVRVTHTH